MSISGLTIANGVATSGAGVYNSATLTISSSRVRSNHILYPSGGSGAGIYNSGNLIVTASTISENDDRSGGCCGCCGGGVHNSKMGTLTISDTTISGNSVVWAFCILTCEYYFGYGGGVSNQGTLTISNSTIYANAGGGIGGLVADMRNTILAGNRPNDLEGRLSSSGYNLIGNTSGGSGFDATDLLNVNPMLGPLQDNGGPTFTHALLPGSPAIDAGGPDFVGPPDFDQRGEGFPRIVNGIVDIGAFEVQADSGARQRR